MDKVYTVSDTVSHLGSNRRGSPDYMQVYVTVELEIFAVENIRGYTIAMY